MGWALVVGGSALGFYWDLRKAQRGVDRASHYECGGWWLGGLFFGWGCVEGFCDGVLVGVEGV